MEPGKFYHIYNRGNNKGKIFFEERNYFHFLNLADKYLPEFADIYSYCLMPNHFHFLVRIKDHAHHDRHSFKENHRNQTALQKAFKYFFMSYAKAINKGYNRTGALFQQKFKRKEITNDGYFTEIIQYIHANPIKAGLCRNYTDWPFSSYRHIIAKEQTTIPKKAILEWFAGRDRFIKLHEDYRGL